MENATTLDALLDQKLLLRQPAKGHRAGTDALLLAAVARGLPGKTVADFGAGVGTAGLALALFEPVRQVVLVEFDPALAALAHENAERNHLAERVRVIEADLTSAQSMRQAGLQAGLSQGAVDLVMMNPPFLDTAASRSSPLAQRRNSHAMPAGTLALWLKAARRVLRPGGHVAVVHRADAMSEVLAALQPGFGGVTLRPIYPREGQAANRLLVTAKLNSKTPTVILPGLILHDVGGNFTRQAEAIHRQLEVIASS